MRHAVIVAHPNAHSFTIHMAQAYTHAAHARHDTVFVRDLYRMGFDPCLKEGEVPTPKGFAPAEDVKAEREMIHEADVFAFFYPLWFNAPPAILKGYIDRVFGMGFGYGMGEGGNEPLLRGRRMISFTSSGAPQRWLKETGSWDAMRKLFDEHVAGVCGFTVIDHIHFDSIVPGITEESVEACAQQVREVVESKL
ncbi:MAG: NAD(P)H-dependent oxidoreductase [Ignavibacteriales bacterium]